MGGGNGAKAAQKRERNAKDALAKKGGTSQLKSVGFHHGLLGLDSADTYRMLLRRL